MYGLSYETIIITQCHLRAGIDEPMERNPTSLDRRKLLQAGAGAVATGLVGSQSTAVVAQSEDEEWSQLGYGQASETLTVDPANFRINVTPGEDLTVEPGEALEFDVEVENTGEEEDTQMVVFTFDGEALMEEEITLEGGESGIITFYFEAPEDEGDWNWFFSIDDNESTTWTLTVEEEVSEPADFAIINAIPAQDLTVEPGEALEFDVEVENFGEEEGTQIVVFTFDGEPLIEEEITLEGGESDSVTFDIPAPDEEGEWEWFFSTDDDESMTWTLTVELAPANFEVVDMFPGEDLTVEPGEALTIDVGVENTGEEVDTQMVVFNFDGEALIEEEITLDGGESDSVTFDFDVPDEEGEWEWFFSTDDDESMTSTLTADEDSWLPEAAAAVSGVSVLSIAGYALFRRQRGGASPAVSESEAQSLAAQARSTNIKDPTENIFTSFQEAITSYRKLAERTSDEDEQTRFGTTADELLTELCSLPEEISNNAHQAKEERNHQTALDEYDRAIELCELIVEWLPADDPQSDSLQEQLTVYRSERDAIETTLAARNELTEVLTTAEGQLQSAIVAHARGEKTAARTRYRQARTNFDRARTQLRDTEDDLIESPVEIEVNPEDQNLLDELETVTEFSAETRDILEREGIETVEQLQQRISESGLVDGVFDSNLPDDQQAVIELLGNWQGAHTRRVDRKQQLQERYSVADKGYQAVV